MGNAFNSKPSAYSDETHINASRMFGGDYEASYRQSNANADSMAYGNNRLQFGVKMMEDVDAGPMRGEMYVTTNAGKRMYFTHDHQLRGDASYIISQGANYGNGPAVSITGTPLNPQYHMFYAQGGDEHTGNDWTPIQINSKKDIMEAMTSGNEGRNLSSGKYSNMYGQAAIDPFGAKEGADVWTGAIKVGKVLNAIAGQLIIPIGEAALDTVTGGMASTVMGVTGLNKKLQGGLDNLIQNTKGKTYQGSASFDPDISNMIKDPRLAGYLQNQEDQMHGYVKKFGPSSYSATQRLAQDTPSQQIQKAQQLAQENETNYVQSQVQQMQDLSDKLQTMVGSKLGPDQQQIFQQIKTGLGMASNNQQKLNVINHFSQLLQSQVLPLITSDDVPAPSQPSTDDPPTSNTSGVTSSAQVGHPVLSINGTHSTHPGKTEITGHMRPPPPVVPIP